MAFNSQTNATTNNFRTSNTSYINGQYGTTISGGGQATGWSQTGVTGAFATAGTVAVSFNTPTVWVRVA